MSLTKQSEAKVLINALNPEIRGDQIDLTDKVKSRLTELLDELKAEALDELGVEVQAVEGVMPDSAQHDYEWVLARIERVLAHGPESLPEPVVPYTTPPVEAEREQPKK